MANMYPKNISEYLPTDSERIVYQELKNQLPDTFDVFYAVSWTSYYAGRLVKSEADFIVASPDYGFLCLEVKGGNGIRIEDNNWYLSDAVHGERKLNSSPYDQAEKNMSALNFNWNCEEDRTDELGVLAHSLNEMSKKLSAALENLQAANIKLQADIEHEKELEQAQLDFFSAVSHELKTPITIIKGQTEGMILNVGDYQDRNKYLSRSLEIINTMESMVQEILTVSRMKSSKVGLRKEKMDFSDLLKREYALFEDLIVQKEIDWNENISPALQIVVDKMLIQKAINNIVSNAILYSPRGSSIYMDAFSKNGSVVFQIENTGVHIPEAEIPKLFDAFYRMEQSRNRKTGGSGLGLYIVKTILEQHNIIYSLKNTDRGVLFSIRF